MATEPAIKSPLLSPTVDRRRKRSQERPRDPFAIGAWLVVAVVVLGLSVVIVVASGMRPGYDAFGWLVWGQQVLHWNLNTDGAPSWKPLTFVFTLPYALAGQRAGVAVDGDSVAGALAGCVFAARIAYMLTGPCPQPALGAVRGGRGRGGRRAGARYVFAAGPDRQLGP